jgi:hypothetical protein
METSDKLFSENYGYDIYKSTRSIEQLIGQAIKLSSVKRSINQLLSRELYYINEQSNCIRRHYGFSN